MQYAGIREVPSSNLDPLSEKTCRISHLFVTFSHIEDGAFKLFKCTFPGFNL